MFRKMGQITRTSRFTDRELKIMRPEFAALLKSIELIGNMVPGAEDRQKLISSLDQKTLSRSYVLFIGRINS